MYGKQKGASASASRDDSVQYRAREMYAIGIDLGTTNSCVAVSHDGREEVFKNDYGQHVTPSCVAFTKNKILIGDEAKHQMIREPENTIYSVKRIIGRKFDDPKTQEDIRRWQFKVERSESGRPLIKIDQRMKTYNIEEISGLVLNYMRRIACKKLDEDVRDAVVTVPAYFNHMQRTATKTAAELAGLNVLGIINEPTAAAIAFGLMKEYPENCNVLVYDFGGGTLDVTVLNINGNKYDVKASSGNAHLGGDDFTNRLVDYFVKYLKTEMGKDITDDKIAMSKLWMECEKMKKYLSSSFAYQLLIENIADGITLAKRINRIKFVSFNKDLFDRTIDYVKDAIKEAGMCKEDINFVIPVGGSCRIPHIIQKLKNYFGEDVVKAFKSPEQAIASGAAVYAANLKGKPARQVYLSEVASQSIGIRLPDNKTNFIVKRNEKLTHRKVFFKVVDYPEAIPVCQGDEELFKDNAYLGKLSLDKSMSMQHKEFEAEFSQDMDGIVQVKATKIGLGRWKAQSETAKMRLPAACQTTIQLRSFTAEKIIGPEGGSIELLGCHLYFPPYVFKTPTVVKITIRSIYDDALEGFIVISPEFECTTSGVPFKGLATITVPIHALSNDDEVVVVTKQDRKSDWRVMNVNTTVKKRKVAFQISHFTFFKILARYIKWLNTILCHNVYYNPSESKLLAVTCIDDEAVKTRCREYVEGDGFINALTIPDQQISLCLDDKMSYRFSCKNPKDTVVEPKGEFVLTRNDFKISSFDQQNLILVPPPNVDQVSLQYFISTPDTPKKEHSLNLKWKQTTTSQTATPFSKSNSFCVQKVPAHVRHEEHPLAVTSLEAQGTSSVAPTFQQTQVINPVSNVYVYRSARQFYDSLVGSPDVYLIDQNRMKGKVLMINNEFLNRRDFRIGSMVDVGNLKNLWAQFGFQVLTKRNLGGEDMRQSCRNFSRDTADINVLILIIMSHGTKRHGKEMICGEDNQEVSTEEIISNFTSKNAPHLRGIPKVFMFQACRGDGIERDVEELFLDADEGPDRYPERSDMLIVYPSQAGYASFRSSETGSWLMNAVTNIFMRDAKDTHVLDMLTTVNREISLKKSEGGYVQMSNQVSYLRKKLFLFPGWPKQ